MENGDAPATKADLAAIKADVTAVKADVTAVKGDVTALKGDVTAIKGDVTAIKGDVTTLKEDVTTVRADLTGLEERMSERMQDIETRLLRAFYAFAETNQKRMLLMEGTDANILSRLVTLEGRMLDVEKRLNIPPTQ